MDKNFDKPISELAWDIIKSTKRANAFLAVAEYLKELRLFDPDRAMKLGMELLPLVQAGLKEYRNQMYFNDNDNENEPISEVRYKNDGGKTYSTLELASLNEKAFNALPESYQSDDVMVFYFNNGDLYGEPKESQVGVLGNWKVVYDIDTKSWVEV